jgi:hypothetical protein
MGFLGVYSFFGAYFDRRGTEETEGAEVFCGAGMLPAAGDGFLGGGFFFWGFF